MKCPYCKEMIDDDSWFCDQCGKEIKICPKCHLPKRGTECPACGADLVSAKSLAAKATETPKPEQASTSAKPTILEGEDLKLTLKEGLFGRTTGIYPELGSQIYISGQHGELRCENGQWQIRDLGSRNGTFVNGVRLSPNVWTDLHLGDQVKIATTKFEVK